MLGKCSTTEPETHPGYVLNRICTLIYSNGVSDLLRLIHTLPPPPYAQSLMKRKRNAEF